MSSLYDLFSNNCSFSQNFAFFYLDLYNFFLINLLLYSHIFSYIIYYHGSHKSPLCVFYNIFCFAIIFRVVIQSRCCGACRHLSFLMLKCMNPPYFYCKHHYYLLVSCCVCFLIFRLFASAHIFNHFLVSMEKEKLFIQVIEI